VFDFFFFGTHILKQRLVCRYFITLISLCLWPFGKGETEIDLIDTKDRLCSTR
jgi:hypothetical protein